MTSIGNGGKLSQKNLDAIPLFLDKTRPENSESMSSYWQVGGRRPRKFLPLYRVKGTLGKLDETSEKRQLEAQAKREIAAKQKELAPRLESLGKEFENFVNRTLTKGQLDAFKALKGKPFVPKGQEKKG